MAFAFFAFFFTHDVDSIFEKRENLEMPLFGELSRSSRDSFESDSDSKASRDVRLNSPKSGVSNFLGFFGSIDSIIRSVRSIVCRGVVGDRSVKQKKIQNERHGVKSAGQSTTALRRSIDRSEMIIESIESKKRKMPLLKELSRTSRDSFESDSDSKESWDVRLNSFKSSQIEKCHL